MKMFRYFPLLLCFMCSKSFITTTKYTNKFSTIRKLDGLQMRREDSNKLSFLYNPKTKNQKTYVNALNNKDDCITVQ